MATTKIIGKVSIIPCGTYVDGTTYTRLSVVNYQGGSYIALVDNTNIAPTNDSVWYLLTAPGRGIQQIEKIGTVGLVDTYRITYTDGTHFDYTVNNGASKTSELTNDAGFITNQVNNLVNYLLAVDTGAYIELLYDSEGYTVTANLKNSSNTIISTSTAQLPLGGNYVSSSYNDGVITLTKLNGTSDTVELSDLVKKSTTIAGLYLADNITASELIEALDVYTILEINDNFYSNSVVGENITINDSSNLNINEFELLGNASQPFEQWAYTGTLGIGNYKFTIDDVNYYFTSNSSYSVNATFVFNKATMKITEDEIMGIEMSVSTTALTSTTTITFSAPTPDNPVPINVVTGDNTVKVVGKNLFSGEIEYNNSVLASNGAINSSANFCVTRLIRVKPSSNICISWKFNQTPNDTIMRVGFYTEDGTFISRPISSVNPYILETPSNCRYIRLSYVLGNGNYFVDVQVEQGSTATDYEPHTEQTQLLSLGDIELAKIGDYRDRIYKDNGKWWLEKNIQKLVLNGSENWALNATNNDYTSLYCSSFSNILISANNTLKKYSLCNKLQPMTRNEWYTSATQIEGLGISSTKMLIVKIATDKLSEGTATSFKNWLANNNLVAYVVLATPTTTEITDTTLLTQLENVSKFNTYKNITNIYVITNNLLPTLYVDYASDIQITINNLKAMNQNLLNQIPQVTINDQQINVKDSSNLPIQDFQIQGNASQNTNIMTYVCSGNESGYYYFVYNNINYQFIMPTITQGELLTFDTITLTLYQGTTQIATTSDNTGTLITLATTPNPDYPQDIHVVTGDNTVKVNSANLLAYPSDWTETKNYVVFTQSGGKYTINGTSSGTGASASTTAQEITNYTIKANDYLHYKNTINDSHIGVTIKFSDNTTLYNSFNNLDRIYNLQNYVGKTIIAIWFNFNNGYTFNGTASPMILNGISTSTDFIKYEQTTQLISLGSIELAKIGDYTDRIYKSGDKWYLEKKIDKDIYNGAETETWNVVNTGTVNWFYSHLWDGSVLSGASCLSNLYPATDGGITNSNTKQGINMYHSSSTRTGVRIRWGTEDTISNFKTFLSTHNLIVYRVNETPTTIEITDKTLISQLENILAMTTYKNITNIFDVVVSPNEIPYLQVTYKQDLDTLLDNLDARITLLE